LVQLCELESNDCVVGLFGGHVPTTVETFFIEFEVRPSERLAYMGLRLLHLFLHVDVLSKQDVLSKAKIGMSSFSL
jgi:hypothetical protein